MTGASSGIGLALAEQLLSDGAHVIALCRTAPPLTAVEHIPVDLTDGSALERAFHEIGAFDILVNNAGRAYSAPIADGALAEWDEMWQVNVRALAYCSHLSLQSFPEEGGQIINISSMSGHRVPPSGGFYASTKFAVRAITEALRLELRSKGNPTRISSISPGFVDTPLLDTYFQGKEDQLKATKEAIQFLTARQIADQVMHILKTPLNVEIGDISLRSASQAV